MGRVAERARIGDELMRQSGALGPEAEADADADEQARRLGFTGRRV